ncbi:MAG: hypothetical protein J1F09_00290 [Oscillospiraceae bacterium]|nr:hypothetical protein [Oscillospiraceae bacterium]
MAIIAAITIFIAFVGGFLGVFLFVDSILRIKRSDPPIVKGIIRTVLFGFTAAVQLMSFVGVVIYLPQITNLFYHPIYFIAPAYSDELYSTWIKVGTVKGNEIFIEKAEEFIRLLPRMRVIFIAALAVLTLAGAAAVFFAAKLARYRWDGGSDEKLAKSAKISGIIAIALSLAAVVYLTILSVHTDFDMALAGIIFAIPSMAAAWLAASLNGLFKPNPSGEKRIARNVMLIASSLAALAVITVVSLLVLMFVTLIIFGM